MNARCSVLWLVLVLGLLGLQEVRAQGSDEVAPVTSEATSTFRGPPQEPRFRFALYQRGKLRADLDEDDARVSVYRTGLSGQVGKWFGYIRLSLRISGERSVYDLSQARGLNAPPDPVLRRDPWGVLSLARFNLSALIPLGRSGFSIFAFGGVRVGWETGTEADQGVSGSFGVVLGYKIDETLTLQVGFLAITRIEDSAFGFPIFGVRWNPTDWFRLETRGPGIEAGLKPVDELELTLSARFDNRQFRLEDRRTFLAEHIVEDQEVLVELGATWQPIGPLVLWTKLGLVAYQEFEIRDRRGEARYRTRTDPAPYVEVGVALDF